MIILLNNLFVGTLTQAIRNFSKGLESWLTSAMQGCPEEMISIKVSIFFKIKNIPPFPYLNFKSIIIISGDCS